ncbi:unnamed protein product, partial [Diplocarpon coronariae]
QTTPDQTRPAPGRSISLYALTPFPVQAVGGTQSPRPLPPGRPSRIGRLRDELQTSYEDSHSQHKPRPIRRLQVAAKPAPSLHTISELEYAGRVRRGPSDSRPDFFSDLVPSGASMVAEGSSYSTTTGGCPHALRAFPNLSSDLRSLRVIHQSAAAQPPPQRHVPVARRCRGEGCFAAVTLPSAATLYEDTAPLTSIRSEVGDLSDVSTSTDRDTPMKAAHAQPLSGSPGPLSHGLRVGGAGPRLESPGRAGSSRPKSGVAERKELSHSSWPRPRAPQRSAGEQLWTHGGFCAGRVDMIAAGSALQCSVVKSGVLDGAMWCDAVRLTLLPSAFCPPGPSDSAPGQWCKSFPTTSYSTHMHHTRVQRDGGRLRGQTISSTSSRSGPDPVTQAARSALELQGTVIPQALESSLDAPKVYALPPTDLQKKIASYGDVAEHKAREGVPLDTGTGTREIHMHPTRRIRRPRFESRWAPPPSGCLYSSAEEAPALPVYRLACASALESAAETGRPLADRKSPTHTAWCRSHLPLTSPSEQEKQKHQADPPQPLALRSEGSARSLFSSPIRAGSRNPLTARGGAHACTGKILHEGGRSWGLLKNLGGSEAGRCREEPDAGHEVLWDTFDTGWRLGLAASQVRVEGGGGCWCVRGAALPFSNMMGKGRRKPVGKAGSGGAVSDERVCAVGRVGGAVGVPCQGGERWQESCCGCHSFYSREELAGSRWLAPSLSCTQTRGADVEAEELCEEKRVSSSYFVRGNYIHPAPTNSQNPDSTTIILYMLSRDAWAAVRSGHAPS